MIPKNDRAPGTEQGAEGRAVIATTSSMVARGTVVPYLPHRAQIDSDAHLAGELAAARVARLEPLHLTERCSCQAASIEWLRWAGQRFGGCPHGLEVAS